MGTENQGPTRSEWELCIPYYHDDFRLRGSTDSAECSRSYLVPGGQGAYPIVQSIISHFMGYPYMIGTESASPEMRRWLPDALPILLDSNNNGYIYASSYELRPFTGGGLIDEFMEGISPQIFRAWDNFILTVNYKTEMYDVRFLDDIDTEFQNNIWFPDSPFPGAVYAPEMFRFVQWDDDDKVEMGQADRAAWQIYQDEAIEGSTYNKIPDNTEGISRKLAKDASNIVQGIKDSHSSNPTPVGDKLLIPIPSGEVTLTLYNWHPSNFSDSSARQLEGKTNLWPFLGYDPGTLVFIGFKRRRRRGILGNIVYNIDLKFLLKPQGANYTLTPAGNGWCLIYSVNVQASNGADVHPIQYADFGYLFVPNPNGNFDGEVGPGDVAGGDF